jgi:glycosyltransferase involved in cell wall biosynthesis
LNGPKLGYVGNLEAKIDIQLLDFLASQRRDWHVVLIGSTHARPEVLTLDRHPNVHFLGVIPYPEVRGWIAEFDVALIPHLDTPQTRAMNPLKLYVYAALGVPIVAKSISNISDLEECVSIADTNEAFVTLVDEALKRRRQRGVLAQTDSLEANCWTSRIRELFELIDRYEASASEGDWPDASAIGASV